MLDAAQIITNLPMDQRGIWDLRVVHSIPSTHSELSDAARLGAASGTVLLAEEQTAGRGRAGRAWFTPAGSQMALTLIWRLNAPSAGLSGLSLVTGLAAAESLTQLGLCKVMLKWPNDLYWSGRKLGGILVEVQGNPTAQCALIVSIGINVSTCDTPFTASQIDQPIVDCRTALGYLPDRHQLTALFLTAWHKKAEQFFTHGFDPFRVDWNAHDHLFGKKVILNTSAEPTVGYAAGVESSGALLVDTSKGRVSCFAGDVHLCKTSPALAVERHGAKEER